MRRHVAALVAATLLAACGGKSADLSAVQQFSKIVANSDAGFAAIAADLYATCRETREFVGATRLAGSGAIASDDLATRPLEPTFPQRPTEPPATPAAAASVPPSPDPSIADPRDTNRFINGDPRCVSAGSLSRRWDGENKVVIDYVRSLGDLANVGTAPDQKTFESLGSSLKNEGVIANDGIAKAAADFVVTIGTIVNRRKQERTIADVVGAAQRNDAFPTLVRHLRGPVLDAYGNELRNEKTVVDKYYTLAIESELTQLKALRGRNGLDPDPIVGTLAPDAARSPAPAPSAIAAAARRATARPCDARCRQSNVRIAELRDRILVQRARWTKLDDAIADRASKMAPYHATMLDLDRMHARLVHDTPAGPRGLLAAVQPFVGDLIDQTAALGVAIAPTPTPKPKSK
ncbi:MAG TPA: hypothetical protein VHT53_00740 [Candidatus Elarobacter sp.]|nr:hypothetical protein [Candidatus Elarobacter sp.]